MAPHKKSQEDKSRKKSMNTITTECQWWKNSHKRKWRPIRTYCRVGSWEGREFGFEDGKLVTWVTWCFC